MHDDPSDGATTEVAAICDALQANPLFHLSLNSKELFHSNLLAWLFETHPAAAAEALAGLVPAGPVTEPRVQREKNHLDLAVELPGRAPFVIENKVFSPPDEEQLDRYTSGALAGLVDPTLILLSLGSPDWPSGTHTTRGDDPHEWKFVSYLDLAGALARVPHAIGGFDGELVRYYVTFIRDLHRLASTVGEVSGDEPVALYGESGRLLRSIRMHDAISKLRARSAIASARAHSRALLGDLPIRWEALYTNAAPLNAAFLDKGDGDWLGWQYQGGQWRVVVITNRFYGTDPDDRASRHAYVADRYAKWFDFEPLLELTGRPIDDVPRTEAEGEYLGYNPDFVYRYRQAHDLTLNELTALSHHYLVAAARWELPTDSDRPAHVIGTVGATPQSPEADKPRDGQPATDVDAALAQWGGYDGFTEGRALTHRVIELLESHLGPLTECWVPPSSAYVGFRFERLRSMAMAANWGYLWITNPAVELMRSDGLDPLEVFQEARLPTDPTWNDGLSVWTTRGLRDRTARQRNPRPAGRKCGDPACMGAHIPQPTEECEYCGGALQDADDDRS